MDLYSRIISYLKSTYLPRRGAGHYVKFFAKGAALVSETFTSERSSMPKNYFNRPEYRSGYLLYFLLSNLPKITRCLEMVDPAQRFAKHSRVTMLDLGCGPGTAALAAAEYWERKQLRLPIDILGVDQNKNILKDARNIFELGNYPNETFRTATATVSPKNLEATLRGQRFDIIVCANVLNELGPMHQRERLIQHLLRNHLTKTGVIILIEPALQRTTRELMQLRDTLVSTAHIIAPCLHQESCPMLRHNKRDWCHAYLQWTRPKLIADVDLLIGNKKDYLKYSYLILSVDKNCPPGTVPDGRFLVVSSLLRSKGKSELLLCPDAIGDPKALIRLTRLDKDRSATNADFDRALRGDIVATSDPKRISKDSTFSIIEPFNRS